MTRRTFVPLALTLAFLLLVASLLVAGGLQVRNVIAASFEASQGLRAARILVSEMLQDQLDEETGMRGYVAARQPVLLEPFYAGRSALPLTYARLHEVILGYHIRSALAPLNDAMAMNGRWMQKVARPLLSLRHHSARLEVRGKEIVDRFRTDMAVVDENLAIEAARSDQRAQVAILLVGVLAFGAVAAVLLAATFFTIGQYKLSMSLERQREAAEHERRKSAEMRAAYEAEKRIADTLQEAFAQRRLPQLTAVRFSAAYVPATEEAHVGGDWYDALQLTQERALFVIGDVAGHGIEAAVAMDKARQALVSCALMDPTPGKILEHVNTELLVGQSPMITAIVGVVDARARTFSYSAAGHPAPALVEPGKRARLLSCGSLPLGVSPDARYRTYDVAGDAGAMLVLYTDGAIEHSRDVVAGEAQLLDAIDAVAAHPIAGAAKAILAEIFGERKGADDVAILTILLAGAPVAPVLADFSAVSS